MDYKKTNGNRTTETLDKNQIDKPTGNIYEAISILAKRSDQIGSDIKTELHNKLEE